MHLLRIKVLIARINPQEESVVRCSVELWIGENRIAKSRQAVESQHRKHGRECRKQNGQFKSNRDESGKRYVGLTRNDVWVVNCVGPNLHGQCYRRASGTGDQREPWQDRRLDSERLVNSVNRKRRERIGLGVARITDFPSRVEQLVFVFVFCYPAKGFGFCRFLYRLMFTHRGGSTSNLLLTLVSCGPVANPTDSTDPTLMVVTTVCVAMLSVCMLAHHPLHFADRDDRQVTAEQEEQCRKQPKAAHEHQNVDPSR